MSKITAEQAAQLFHDKTIGHATDDTLLEDFTERDREQEYIMTFVAGSAWQREQDKVLVEALQEIVAYEERNREKGLVTLSNRYFEPAKAALSKALD